MYGSHIECILTSCVISSIIDNTLPCPGICRLLINPIPRSHWFVIQFHSIFPPIGRNPRTNRSQAAQSHRADVPASINVKWPITYQWPRSPLPTDLLSHSLLSLRYLNQRPSHCSNSGLKAHRDLLFPLLSLYVRN
uniref:Ovule protein n=1 Tax=Ascaris lumbricoides TaxID=6252 RepID=A0A0M3HV52_ASCLU